MFYLFSSEHRVSIPQGNFDASVFRVVSTEDLAGFCTSNDHANTSSKFRVTNVNRPYQNPATATQKIVREWCKNANDQSDFAFYFGLIKEQYELIDIKQLQSQESSMANLDDLDFTLRQVVLLARNHLMHTDKKADISRLFDTDIPIDELHDMIALHIYSSEIATKNEALTPDKFEAQFGWVKNILHKENAKTTPEQIKNTYDEIYNETSEHNSEHIITLHKRLAELVRGEHRTIFERLYDYYRGAQNDRQNHSQNHQHKQMSVNYLVHYPINVNGIGSKTFEQWTQENLTNEQAKEVIVRYADLLDQYQLEDTNQIFPVVLRKYAGENFTQTNIPEPNTYFQTDQIRFILSLF